MCLLLCSLAQGLRNAMLLYYGLKQTSANASARSTLSGYPPRRIVFRHTGARQCLCSGICPGIDNSLHLTCRSCKLKIVCMLYKLQTSALSLTCCLCLAAYMLSGAKTLWQVCYMSYSYNDCLCSIPFCRKPILFGASNDTSNTKVAVAIKGRFSMARSNHHRGIDISVEYTAQYSNGSSGHSDVQIFSMTMSP